MESIDKLLAKIQSMGSVSEPLTQEQREKNNAETFNASNGSLNEQDGYNCNVCHNKGLIMKAYQTDSGYWSTACRECKCMDVRRSIRKMERSGLKNIIRDYTFDKFNASEPWQQTLKEAAEHYARHPEGWFFIGGQSGAGKTHLCTAICREFLLAGRAVKYMLWRDDIVRLKLTANKDSSDEYSSSMTEYKTVEVLYIDDLFKTGKDKDGNPQFPTSADINIAFEILNYRYNNPDLLTVISSECMVNDLVFIDEATGGRIFEKAKAFSLKPDKAKNYRLRGVTEL